MAGIMHTPKFERLTVPMTFEQFRYVERYARQEGVSMADVMRQALEEFRERRESKGE